ncbi:MAG: DNA/RNA non-specific endonuclease [Acetobacteraceae bacterium]|nr:DNA/RNA non-specific endonuclease [Acetobacteraceae bacterium]
MAHELAHVVQQSAPAPAVAAAERSPVPARLALSEAPAGETQGLRVVRRAAATGPPAQRQEGGFFDQAVGAVGSVADAAGEAVGDVAEALGPGALFERALGLLPAPLAGLIRDIHTQGVVEYLGGLVRRGLGGIFAGLADTGTALAGAMGAIDGIGARIGQVMGALAGGDCGPLFAAIGGLQAAIGEAAGAAWDRIGAIFAPVGAFFRGIWTRFGAPTIDWLGGVASGVWAEITGIGRQIWEATVPLRAALGGAFGAAWSAITDFLGVGGDEGGSGGGLVGWVSAQANRAWDGIKAQAAPVLEPIGRVAERVAEILPLAGIMDLRGAAQRWLERVSATATALGEPGTVGGEAGQASLRDTLLPALNDAVAGVRDGARAASGWVAGQIGGLADAVAGALDGFGANPVLGAASGALAWLRDGARTLSVWATGGVGAAFAVVDEGLSALGGFARRVLDTLLQLGAALGDLGGQFGDLVLGPLWRAIPACIRDPVADFLVNQILRRIPVFSQLLDVPDLWSRCVGAAMALIRQVFIDGDLARAAWAFFSSMLSLIGLPPDLVAGIVARAASALGDILRDPVGFLANLLRAVKTGLSSFLGNALTHLLNGVSGWLFAQAQRAGLTPPASLSLGEVFRFALDVLGLGVDFIFDRLGRAIGPERVAALRRGVEAVGQGLAWIGDLVAEGPAALWRHVSGQLSDLWNTLLDGVVSWVGETVVGRAIARLLSSLDPSGIGAVVNSVITIYRAIESAVEYMRPMLEIVRSVLDGMGDIARGAIAGAAAFVENGMARAVPIVVGFLANQVGLGNVGHRIGEMVERLRERIARVVDRLIQGALGLLRRMAGAAGATAGTTRGAGADRQEHSFTFLGERHTIRLHDDGGGVLKVQMASGAFGPMRTKLRTVRERYADPATGYLVRIGQAGEADKLRKKLEALGGTIDALEASLRGRLPPPMWWEPVVDELELFAANMHEAFGPGGALRPGDVIVDKESGGGMVVDTVGDLREARIGFTARREGRSRFFGYDGHGGSWDLPGPKPPSLGYSPGSGSGWRSFIGLQNPLSGGGGSACPSTPGLGSAGPVSGRVRGDQGHLVANILGGPGSCDNIVAMHNGANQGQMKRWENFTRGVLNRTPAPVVNYMARPIWDAGHNPSAHAPDAIEVEVTQTYPLPAGAAPAPLTNPSLPSPVDNR